MRLKAVNIVDLAKRNILKRPCLSRLGQAGLRIFTYIELEVKIAVEGVFGIIESEIIWEESTGREY